MYLAGIVVGSVLRQGVIHSQHKKALRLSVKTAEEIAEAEVKYEKSLHKAESTLQSLDTRMSGVMKILETKFADTFRPFESAEGKVVEDLLGRENALALAKFQKNKPSVQLRNIDQLPNYKKGSGGAAKTASILFGRLGETSWQLDAARTQRAVARMAVSEIELVYTILDAQCIKFKELHQTLGALNVALLIQIGNVARIFEEKPWILDTEGHVDNSVGDYLSAEEKNAMGNCINMAISLYALMEKPVLDENCELTMHSKKMLNELNVLSKEREMLL